MAPNKLRIALAPFSNVQVKLFGSEIEAGGGVLPPGIKDDRLGGESN